MVGMQSPQIAIQFLLYALDCVLAQTRPKFRLSALIERQATIHGRLKVELQTELFNSTNSVNFGGPQTSSGPGIIALTQVNNPRAIQLGLRVVF